MMSEKTEDELLHDQSCRLLDFQDEESDPKAGDVPNHELRVIEGDYPEDDNIKDSDEGRRDGILVKVSKKVDLFFSPDGKTLPRVSMLSNIAYMIPAHVIVIIANLIVSEVFKESDYYRNLSTFYIKLYTRLSVVASIYILYSIYLLGVKKIPSGMMLAVAGVHAFLMNRKIYELWPAWIVASLWSFGAGCFLYMEGKKPSFARDICIWALYSNLICLSLPNIAQFEVSPKLGDPALLARSALLLSGHALGHPTFKLYGFFAVFGMVYGFIFPYGSNSQFIFSGVVDYFFQARHYTQY